MILRHKVALRTMKITSGLECHKILKRISSLLTVASHRQACPQKVLLQRHISNSSVDLLNPLLMELDISLCLDSSTSFKTSTARVKHCQK